MSSKRKINPLIEFPISELKPNENILPVNENVKHNKTLKPYYYATNITGKVYSISSGKFHELHQFLRDGYYQTRYYNTDGTASTIKTHRIILSTFDKNPEMYEKYINHIDGVKTNNNIDNLEWCTAKENVHHAFENGLNSHGVKDETIIKIFDMLNKGCSKFDIANKLGISEQTVENIKTGQLHFKEKLKKLGISPLYEKRQALTDNDIRDIIKMAKEGKSDNYIANIKHCKPYTIIEVRTGNHRYGDRLAKLGLPIIKKNI